MQNIEIALTMSGMAAAIVILVIIALYLADKNDKLVLKGMQQERRITGLLIAIDRYAEREKSHVLQLEEYRERKWIK